MRGLTSINPSKDQILSSSTWRYFVPCRAVHPRSRGSDRQDQQMAVALVGTRVRVKIGSAESLYLLRDC